MMIGGVKDIRIVWCVGLQLNLCEMSSCSIMHLCIASDSFQCDFVLLLQCATQAVSVMLYNINHTLFSHIAGLPVKHQKEV